MSESLAASLRLAVAVGKLHTAKKTAAKITIRGTGRETLMAVAGGTVLRRGIAVCLLALTTLAQSTLARSEENYPSRPIRMVVPFAAGGTSDVLARLIGQNLGVALGQQIVVENRSGANGNIGTEVVAKSQPDGYTLVLVADGTVAINPSLYADLPFDPERDLVPVSRVALVPLILVAHPSLKVNSIQQLIALSKEPASDLLFSSAGFGSTGHLTGELLKSQTGLRMSHVNYKGGGEAVNDVIGGRVQLLVTALATAGSFLKGGQLKAIAVTSGKRVPSAPDVPTIAEGGVKDFNISSWYAVMAPAGTDAAIVEKLHAALATILHGDDLKAKMDALGTEPIGDSPAEFAKVLRDDLGRWKRVVQDAKLSIQ
jgi:tripartite-type tricarboxylate transporter receptor subunit TctC